MDNILLIFQTIGDLFDLKNPLVLLIPENHQWFEIASKCNKKYVNGESMDQGTDDFICRLSTACYALQGIETDLDPEFLKEVQKLSQFDLPANLNQIVICGFIL